MNSRELFKGVKGIIQSTMSDKIVTDDVFNTRKSICVECEHIVYSDQSKSFKTSKCGICRCWLKYKLKLKDEKCPMVNSKWDIEV
jgi:hypothetical protein